MPRTITALLAGLCAIGTLAPITRAQDVAASQPAPAPTPAQDPTLADRRFDNVMEGLAFTAPPTCQLTQSRGEDVVAVYSSEQKGWTVTAYRTTLESAQTLDSIGIGAGKVIGYADQLVAALGNQLPGAELVRNDPSNLQSMPVRLLAFRYGSAEQPRLLQQAIIQANPRVYFKLEMVSESTQRTALPNPDMEDPAERQAVEAFSAMFDTVQIYDRTQVREEQELRLKQTFIWLTNLNASNLVPLARQRQYMRYVKDGKDVGWEFSTMDIAEHANRPGIRSWKATFIVTGDKTHHEEIFSGFAGFDRKYSIWERRTADFDGKNYAHTSEVGTTDSYRETQVLDADRNGDNFDQRPSRRNIIQVDRFALNVSLRIGANSQPPMNWDLGNEYLAQSLGDLLPQLMAETKPNKYMLASYWPQTHSLIRRYVDCQGLAKVRIDGIETQAIVVEDRLGFSNKPVTHYVSLQKEYLGSKMPILNSDGTQSVLWTLPSNERSILAEWPDALTKLPTDEQRGVLSNSKAIDPQSVLPRTSRRPLTTTRPSGR